MVRGAVLLSAVLVLGGCSSSPIGEDDSGPGGSDRAAPPTLGECRDLDAGDLEAPSDDTEPVPCTEDHTAQTFAVGTLPARTGSAWADDRHGAFVHQRCTEAFRSFLGADESQALRTRLSWAWFRPPEEAWERGARWYRCDVVGGPAGAEELRDLPTTAEGIFSRGRQPDSWLTCARGDELAGSTKVACSEEHDWRAVTAVKIGTPAEAWPGEKIVAARSRDRCSDWVGAWLHYTPDYDFGYTWFHEAEWEAGNRRSVCWARTSD